jgi:broad specificity phosphatase PhoE
MPLITLVRHGRAAAGFGDEHDPGLHPEGVAQAAALADDLETSGPQPIVVSPLRRTRETAAPLAERWGVTPFVEARVAEIPSPTNDLAERAAWLGRALRGTWTGIGPGYLAWRDAVVDALRGFADDTVVVTHFIAINAIVGASLDDDRIVVFNPGYCSRTLVEFSGGRLEVVERGAQAATEVR